MPKCVVVSIGGREFGIPALRVDEILGPTPVAPLQPGEGEVRGVINLRGTLLPVLDLRRSLGLTGADDAGSCADTMLVVVRVDAFRVGLVVDRVPELRDGDADPGAPLLDLERLVPVADGAPA